MKFGVPHITFLLITGSMLVGCSKTSMPEKYEPERAAEAAIEAYDTNQDGQIDAEEMAACAALESSLERIDTNQDGVLDADEISARIASYDNMSKYIVAETVVEDKKRPVSGAEITFEMEEFVGEGLPRFVGTTGIAGIVLPDSDPPGLLGFPLGFYRVTVVAQGKTHAFGAELADDVPTVSSMKFEIP